MPVAAVTGDKGFVGPYLRAHLEELGFEVHGFDLRTGNDVRDYEAVRLFIETVQPTHVFHLAAQAYVPETSTDVRRGFDVNLKGTLNLLEAIRHTGSRTRVHLAGTSEEVGYLCDLHNESTVPTPTSLYGVSKLAASQLGIVYSASYGIPVVVTRAFNHTGPGHTTNYAVPAFAKRVADVMTGRSLEVTHGNLDAVRTYTDVRDMVRAYAMAIELPSGIYNVGSERAVSMRWVLDKLVELSGQYIPTRPDDALHRSGSSQFPKVSCEKFRSATGWTMSYELETTMKEMLDYWRTNA